MSYKPEFKYNVYREIIQIEDGVEYSRHKEYLGSTYASSEKRAISNIKYRLGIKNNNSSNGNYGLFHKFTAVLI